MIHILDLLGTAVFAITGALAAGRKRMDVFGVVVIAFVTALGGGTVRDLVLGRGRVFWASDPTYVIVAVAAAIVTFAYGRFVGAHRGALLIADAFGLAIFTIVGCQKAEEAGVSALIVVIMGLATGVAGGMLRDVLCGEVPLILRKEIYATASLSGAVVFVALGALGVGQSAAIVAATIVVLAARLAAINWNLSLPVLGGEAPDKGRERE